MMTPTITHDDAVRTLRAEYYQAVKSYAEDLRDRIKAGEITDHDGLTEAVDEDVDGSEWVIYTSRNHHLLFVSDNSDAYFDEVGSAEDLTSADGINWATLAYFAMRRDVWEALETLGVDHRYDFGGEESEGNEESEESEEAA